MTTTHRIIFDSADRMISVADGSVDLVVTSPPYPMIQMWDAHFCSLNPGIRRALNAGDGTQAFDLMHQQLDRVWAEVFRVIKDGGILCINIGDATRSLNNAFHLYANHARILHMLLALRLTPLPDILWRKQTNAPNKFMGSGMLPAGAYVTLEHEYILIARKGGKRQFRTQDERRNRRESAFFWEERNIWFSDVWTDLKGAAQTPGHKPPRRRRAAYPFEVAYRLINMFSVKGDLVLDPFLGTGTTTAAAMAAGRHSTGFEIDTGLRTAIENTFVDIVSFANNRIGRRIRDHLAFVEQRAQQHGPLPYENHPYRCPVMTAQETDLWFNTLTAVQEIRDDRFEISYLDVPSDMG